MKQIELKQLKGSAPHLCQDCGGPMRLISSEAHPVEAETDLLTYYCTACDEYFVFPPSISKYAPLGEATHRE